MSHSSPQRFSPSSGSEGGVSPRQQNMNVPPRSPPPYDTGNWVNTDTMGRNTQPLGADTNAPPKRSKADSRMDSSVNRPPPDANSDDEDIDLESFQQKVSEMFSQYTAGMMIHKMDLRDLLEDVGYNVTMEALWEVVKDLGLGVSGEGKRNDDDGLVSKAKNKENLRMPSQFDAEDTLTICSHFYNLKHFVRQDHDDQHITELEIEIHKYIWLTLSCKRDPMTTYKVVRPKWLQINLTPKALLELGAAVVMTLMCALLLAVCCSLWVKRIHDSEREDALSTVKQFAVIAEAFVDNQAPLQQVGEDATYIAGLMEQEYNQQRNDEAAHIAQIGESIVSFAGVDLNFPEQEISIITASLQTAAAAAEVLIRTSANGKTPSGQQAIYSSVILPALLTQRRAVGSPTYSASTASDWDFVVINTTDSNDATRVWTAPLADCATAGTCAYRLSACSAGFIDDVESSTAYADTTISLVTNPYSPTPIPNVVGATISAHLPSFAGSGLTICFFKPKTTFDRMIRSEVSRYFLAKFDDIVKKGLSLPLVPNIVRYNAASGQVTARLTPPLTVQPIGLGCTRSDGCERGGAFNAAIANVVTNCTAYRTRHLAQLSATSYPATNPVLVCNATRPAYDTFDNSSTGVICAALPLGSHYNFAVTDIALMLCIDKAFVKRRVIDLYIWAINNYNVKYSMTTTFEMVLAVRNESTGVINAQVSDYAFGTGPRPCYDYCLRTPRASVGARNSFAIKGSYAESAIDYRPEPVLQGYAYVPSLDVSFGEERDVVNAGGQVFSALAAMIDSYNRQLDHITLVPVTNMVTYEPIQQFNVKNTCPSASYECYTRSIGVVYRGDCPHCSRILGLGVTKLAAPQYDCSGGCANLISQMPIYSRPFQIPAGSTTDGTLEEERSYIGRKSLYAPIMIHKLGLGFGMHFFTEERMSTAYRTIYIGIGSSIGVLLLGIISIRLLARNNLKHVQSDWLRYRQSIQKQKKEFRNIVGDVVPPLYAPLLFKPTSVMSERINITTIFVNVVGFQRFIGEQDADFVHDYTSYLFYTINLVTKYYRFFKVKTFGDNFMIVGGVNKQVRERSAMIRRVLGTEAAEANKDDDEAFGNEEDNEDEVISKCVEAASVLLQLFSYLYVHNPQSVPFLKKRVKARQLTDMAQMRIGISTGPTNLIMTRHMGFPYFLALSEHAAVSYRLQQTAKSNTIMISRDVRSALTRTGRDTKYHFGKETALMHKKIAVTATIISKADIPVPKAIVEALRITRAAVRYQFSNEGGIPMVALAASSSTQSGQSGQQSTVVGGGHGRY